MDANRNATQPAVELRSHCGGAAKCDRLQGASTSSAILARLLPVAPHLGITRVADVTGLDRIGIPVVMVTRPNSRSISVSQGKGATFEDAAVSGLMEAMETWHAERIAGERVVRCPIRDLPSATDVAALPRSGNANPVQHAPLHWIEGYDLLGQTPCWAPIDLVHTNYTSTRVDDGVFLQSTNGLASGSTDMEATLHGLYELIERDAATMWNLSSPERKRSTRIDLETVDDPLCIALLEKCIRADLRVGAWNMTSDVGIATTLCAISPRRIIGGAKWASVGSGCHLDRARSLSSALTEAAQVRLSYIAGSREDLLAAYESRARDAELVDFFLDHCLTSSPRTFASVPSLQTDNVEQELNVVLTKLAAAGIGQAVMVSLGTEEVGIPVVRVVVPGLEGPDDHPLYVPGSRAHTLTDH